MKAHVFAFCDDTGFVIQCRHCRLTKGIPARQLYPLEWIVDESRDAKPCPARAQEMPAVRPVAEVR